MVPGKPDADAVEARLLPPDRPPASAIWRRMRAPEPCSVGTCRRATTWPSSRTRPARILVPPTSTPMESGTAQGYVLWADRLACDVDVGQAVPRVSRGRAGRAARRRAGAESPGGAVARGGGRSAACRRAARTGHPPARRAHPPSRRAPRSRSRLPRRRLPTPPRRRRVRIRTLIAIGVPLILVLLLGWIVLGYLAFRSSVEEANARLEAFKPAVKPVLTPAERPVAEPLDQHPRARRRRAAGPAPAGARTRCRSSTPTPTST